MPRLRRQRSGGDRLPFLLLVPNLVTILGLCAGLTSMRFTMADRFELAAGLIIFAAVIDGLDGLLARRLNAASDFGAELDSLSDFLCFGVAPALLVYRFALDGMAGAGWIFVLVFAIACCLRLARFNVNRSQPQPGGAYFTGVPAPAGAMLGLLPVFFGLAGLADPSAASWLVAGWMALVAFLMVSRLRTFSPKALRITRDQSGALLIGVAIVAGMIFARFWLLMVLCCLAYVAVLVWGVVTARRRARAGEGE